MLEPVVLQKIESHRKSTTRLRVGRTLIWFVPTLVEIILLMSLICYYLTGNVEKSWLGRSWFGALVLVAFVVIVMSMLVALILTARRAISNARKGFSELFEKVPLSDRLSHSLRRFGDSLASLSIAADLECPKMRPVDVNGIAAVPFEIVGEAPSIAVSLDCLALGLNTQEIEGLMAHETSRLMIGAEVRYPGVSSLGNLTYIYQTMLTLMALVGFFWFFKVNVAAVALLCGIAVSLPVLGFINTRFRKLEAKEDLLADSIAVKLTNDPESLASAIRRLAESSLLGELVGHMSFTVQKQDPASVERRLSNLKEIEQGYWQSFQEIVGGEVTTQSNAWE